MKKACTKKSRNNESETMVPMERIEGAIYYIRGNKIMLDRDLAMLYGVETRTLVQAVKRNSDRFPEDFMFQLTKEELENWRSQFVTSNQNCSRSQTVILKRGQNIKYKPYAFTEQGVAMLASVLRSPQAAKINIEIVRAFIRLRETLASNKGLTKELKEVKEFVLKKSNKTDREFRRIWQAIEKLTNPPKKDERKIGFDLN